MTKSLHPQKFWYFLFFIIFLWISRAWIFVGDVQAQEEIDAPGIFAYRLFSQLVCFWIIVRWLSVPVFLKFINKDKLLWILLLVGTLFTYWSVVPLNSLGVIRALFLLFLVSATFELKFHSKEIIELYVKYSFWVILLSVFLALFTKFGVAEGFHEGNWRGAFTHKNNLGEFSCFSSIISVAYMVAYRRINFYFVSVFLISVLCLVFSGSATSLAATLCACLLTLFFSKIGNAALSVRKRILIVTFSFALIVAFVVFMLSDAVDIFGRDLTFTGRTIIWAQYLEFADERPNFGWGWTASSTVDDIVMSVRDVSRVSTLRTTHSVYVQYAVELGYYFAAAYSLWISKTVFFSYFRYASTVNPILLIRGAVATGMLFIGFFESIVGLTTCVWLGVLLMCNDQE